MLFTSCWSFLGGTEVLHQLDVVQKAQVEGGASWHKQEMLRTSGCVRTCGFSPVLHASGRPLNVLRFQVKLDGKRRLVPGRRSAGHAGCVSMGPPLRRGRGPGEPRCAVGRGSRGDARRGSRDRVSFLGAQQPWDSLPPASLNGASPPGPAGPSVRLCWSVPGP